MMQDFSHNRSGAVSNQWTPLSRVALIAIAVLLIVFTALGALGIVSHKLDALVLLIPVLIIVGLLAGLYTPRLSLILLFFMITLEFFYPALLTSGGAHVRIDEFLGLAVSSGTFIRHINNGTARQLFRRVPGRLPAALFVLESLVSALINHRELSIGLPLIAELVIGLMCYAAIVFIASELTNANFILWALLPIAAIEATLGILLYGISRVFHQPDMFGVRVEPTSGLLSTYGTFSEQNFFGHYLAAVTIVIVAIILSLLVPWATVYTPGAGIGAGRRALRGGRHSESHPSFVAGVYPRRDHRHGCDDLGARQVQARCVSGRAQHLQQHEYQSKCPPPADCDWLLLVRCRDSGCGVLAFTP